MYHSLLHNELTLQCPYVLLFDNENTFPSIVVYTLVLYRWCIWLDVRCYQQRVKLEVDIYIVRYSRVCTTSNGIVGNVGTKEH